MSFSKSKRNAVFVSSSSSVKGAVNWYTLQSKENISSAELSNSSTQSIVSRSESNKDLKLYFLRIFRPDNTFSTVCCSLKTTCNELSAILAKKFFVEDDSRYRLFLQCKSFERILGPSDRPIQAFKKLLFKLGYTEDDDLNELAREDNSYYFRFLYDKTYQITTEKILLDIEDMKHVDLANKSLFVIPEHLKRRAHEIEVLNVSKNVMLQLSEKFILSCTCLRILNMSQCRMKQMPDVISSLKGLHHLDVSENKIKSIDNLNTSNFQNLSSLNLANNNISHINIDTFKPLKNTLVYLDVSNNRLEKFPVAICELKALSDLDLSFNRMKTLPVNMKMLESLKRMLIISNCFLDQLPTVVGELNQLRELDIRNNKITDLKPLKKLKHIEKLYCDHNSIYNLNLDFCSLKHINARKNTITQFGLPSVIINNLTYLNLSYSKLVSLPDDIFFKIPNVEILVLNNNHLVSFPQSITKLSKLESLVCSNNVISFLPNDIGNLKKLRHLDIHSNNLKSLPEEIWKLEKTLFLNISSNLIKDLPDFKSDSKNEPGLIKSLATLLAGDNRLTERSLTKICKLVNLRNLNLSYNNLEEIHLSSISNLIHLEQLFLSGNQLTTLPGDQIEKTRNLNTLFINGNNLHTLPAELGKLGKLQQLDVGSNTLRYNICNWPYDWNWNWNLELQYMNLSGNKRFQIKAFHNENGELTKTKKLASFDALKRIVVLGLMDVTIMTNVPEENHNRRIRLSPSEINQMKYGVSDYLHMSKLFSNNDNRIVAWNRDLVHPNFRKSNEECFFVLLDAHTTSVSSIKGEFSGLQMMKYLSEYFQECFSNKLKRAFNGRKDMEESEEKNLIVKAIRRTFLELNKELGSSENRKRYFNTGVCCAFAYIKKKTLYIANVGDTVAVMSRNGGSSQLVSTRHSPWNNEEITRIRNTKGYISSKGLLNSKLEISRAFGHFSLLPLVNANPSINIIDISTNDEFVIIATRSLWDKMSYQTAVDIVRTERHDLLKAAHKLRDFAIFYGAEENVTAMIIGISDIYNESSIPIAKNAPVKKSRRDDDNLGDSTLARLDKEVEPPIGNVILVFTDIKNSTALWETVPAAMRAAVKIHNSIMRRSLRNLGGYEVKTEGDAFMVSFHDVASALLWCLTIQIQLLHADWPRQILDHKDGKEIFKNGISNELLYRGLSVRMGIHCGVPVCEEDPVTKRMDYFGPMVNRSARVSGVADGGQICISQDVLIQLQKIDELINSEQHDIDLPKEIIMLKKIGFNVINIGYKKLKGLEVAENLSLVYPKALTDRFQISTISEGKNLIVRSKSKSQLDTEDLKKLTFTCLRLEHIKSHKPRSKRFSKINYLSGFLGLDITLTKEHQKTLLLSALVIRIENVVISLYAQKLKKIDTFDNQENAKLKDLKKIVRFLKNY